MKHQVAIIVKTMSDMNMMQEAIKVLDEYGVEHQSYFFDQNDLVSLSSDLYKKGIRVIIAGTKGETDFSNNIAAHFTIPTIGLPMRSSEAANTVESVFGVLQQPNEHAVAQVALDAAQNAGILAVQMLATNNAELQQKIVVFKENLKNKILKADQELAQIKFEYRTN